MHGSRWTRRTPDLSAMPCGLSASRRPYNGVAAKTLRDREGRNGDFQLLVGL